MFLPLLQDGRHLIPPPQWFWTHFKYAICVVYLFLRYNTSSTDSTFDRNGTRAYAPERSMPKNIGGNVNWLPCAILVEHKTNVDKWEVILEFMFNIIFITFICESCKYVGIQHRTVVYILYSSWSGAGTCFDIILMLVELCSVYSSRLYVYHVLCIALCCTPMKSPNWSINFMLRLLLHYY